MQKRKLEVVVLSDVHLGTYGSRASELVAYLDSIDPEILVLNGDIVDIWQFSKRYFPQSHMQVLKKITSMLSRGTEVHYIIGNHDEVLRKFNGFQLGNFHLSNKLTLKLSTGKAWIFHGDVFDVTMKHSKWLAKLGGKGYDTLILINTMVNWMSEKMGRGRISLSKKVKDSVKGVVSFVNNFEDTAAEIAIENGFEYVICGHIHQPKIKEVITKKGKTIYLNSGDWVENQTALEYINGAWSMFEFAKSGLTKSSIESEAEINKKALHYDFILEDIIKEIA
jgi:UDP-2,3-diacylglucosamine pyrophosphatase LpxH